MLKCALVVACVLLPSIQASAFVPAPPSARGVMDEVSPALLRGIVDRLSSFGTRHTLSDTTSDTRGIGAARRWVHAEFERFAAKSDGRMVVEFDRFVQPPVRRVPEPVEIMNVMATLRGTMPESSERRIYIMGHLDSRATDPLDGESDAPGANDDASGVALLMELARVLADEPLECTVVFLATSGEEQGLLGARHHATTAAADGIRITAVLSSDMVGDPSTVGGDSDPVAMREFGRRHVRVFSETVPRQPTAEQHAEIWRLASVSDSPSRQVARYIAEIAELEQTAVRPMLIARPDRFLRGGDHSAFNEQGYAAVRFCEVYEKYDRQHQDVRTENGRPYGDLPELVDENYLADVTRLNVACVLHLANAPAPPTDARVITAELTNDTTLRWAANPEPDVAGYEVVWRRTTSPDWEHTQDAGNATEITLPISKDNWFFGVRAYDRDGHRSLISFPVAARR